MQIRNFTEDHIDACVNLSSEAFGFNYRTRSDFESYVHSPAAVVALDGEQIVGFSMGSLADTLFSQVWNVGTIDSRAVVGVYDVMVVHPDYRRRGIGEQLMVKMLEGLCAQVDLIYAFAWRYEGKVNMEGLFAAHGFDYLMDLDKPWKKGCESRKFECPVYHAACKCDAVLYRKVVIRSGTPI